MQLAQRLLALATRPASPRASHVTGALVGLAVMLGIFGAGFALGGASYWEYPRGDAKLYVTGYLHFVQEPWAWPPGMIQNVAPPEGLSLTFADSVPPLAFVLKLLHPLWVHAPSSLRAPFERPYGVWLMIVFALQGVMAARFDRRLGAGTVASAALTAAFVCTLPTFLVRFGHEALDSHFFLLWALLLVVTARSESPPRRHVAEWCALLGLVTLTHPYLLAMCAGLFVVWCAVALLSHRAAVVHVASAAAGGVLAVLLAMSVEGILHLQTIHGRATGFGDASFNPISLVLSQFSGVARVLHVDASAADATGFQYEGQDYLGLGLFALLAFVAVTERRALGASLRRHALLVALFVVFLGFALSNRVFVGRHLLLAYPWPSVLEPFATQFRSSGRFVWAPTYALVLWSAGRVARRGRLGLLLLGGALALQLPDLLPCAGWMRTITAGPEERRLDWRVWQRLVAEHQRVWSYPDYECMSFLRWPDDHVAIGELHELSFIAAEQNRVVSSLFSPRGHRVCLGEVAEREAIAPREGTLFVLFRRVVTGHALVAIERRGARCLAFDDGYACSTLFAGAHAGAEEAASELATKKPYLPDSWVSFADGSDSIVHQGPGWGVADATGRWLGNPAEGARTSVHYVLAPGEAARASHLWEVEVDGEGEQAAAAVAEVGVAMNDQDVGTLRVPRGAKAERYRLCTPPVREGDPGEGRWRILDLFARDPAAPSARGVHFRAARLLAEGC